MDEVNELFGACVRSARESAGLTQQGLALEVGLSRTAITNVEAGKQGTTIEMLYRIAFSLGVEPAALLPSVKPFDISTLIEDEADARKIKHLIDSTSDDV